MPRINTSLLALAAVVLMSACSETISRLSGEAPEAEAGAVQVVDFDTLVQLNGSASQDIDGDELSYLWQQTGGDSVILLSDSDAIVEFTAPAQDSDLTFKLTVTDASGQQDSDSTNVYVRNIPSVEIILDTDVVSEADASLGVRFLLSRSTSSSGTINLDFGGSADYDSDYYLAKSILIPAGESAYDTAIDIYDNELAEGNKSITVAISDASQFAFDSSLTYSITISEDDTTPEFTSSTEHEADDQRLDTDYQASATDADGDEINYSIVGGSDAAAFSIDAASGDLSFAADYFSDFYDGGSDVPLYEQPADSDGDNAYGLTLRVSDGYNYSEQGLVVRLLKNDNLSVPEITSLTSISVNEGDDSVFYTAQAADDTDNDELTWSISGSDSVYLEISTDPSGNGELSFTDAMDYENPLDSEPRANDNVYEINLSVSDGRFSDQQELNISVLNIAETAPALSLGDVASTGLTLNWQEIDGAISYRIYQTTDSDCLADNDTAPTCAEIAYQEAAGIALLVVDDLDNYTEYFFIMLAESEDSYSDLSSVLQVTTTVAPPSDVSFTVLSNSEIDLSWSGVDNADSYNLHRYSNEDCDIDNSLTCADYHYEPDITATAYSDSGLDRAITYYYQLESIGENDVSSEPSQQYGQATAAYHLYNDSGVTYSGLYSSEDSDICEAVGEDASINAEQDCHYGRDADYLANELDKTGAGVAAFDFTKLAIDGSVLAIQDDEWDEVNGEESVGTKWSCVYDNITGLTWEVDSSNDGPFLWGGTGALSGGSGIYYDDWSSTVEDANNNTLCGLNDWRVPTLDEILDLSDMHKDSSPHIDSHYFPDVAAGNQYWTALARGTKAVAFSQATATPAALDTDSSVYVRLVSGVIRGYHWEDSRYQDNADGTVTDLETNLMWAKCSSGLAYDAGICQGGSSSANWKDALETAGASDLAGYDDWRLPNAKELQTLSALAADGSSGVNAVITLGNDDNYLHSSTPDPENDGNSYRLDLSSGLIISVIRSSFDGYILVRSGN